jgi:hypothetical protein
MYVCICVYMYTYIHAYICIYVYMYVCIRPHLQVLPKASEFQRNRLIQVWVYA